MNRKLLWAVLTIGIALALAPLALGLPGKTAAGQRMMNGFQPIMQPDQVATTARYYDDVFVPLGTVTPMMSAQNLAKFQAYLKGFGGMQTDAAKLVPLLAQAMQMTPAQVQALMATQLPSMAAMLQNLPAMQRDFGGLLGTMQQNVGIFASSGWTLPLRPARDDDAGECRELQAGQQPARLPVVHRLLRRPRCPADPACGLRPVRGDAPESDRRRPARSPDARLTRATPLG